MTPADRRAALAEARRLVQNGATLAQAARACSIGIDTVKRASTREGWVKDRTVEPKPAALTLGDTNPENLQAAAEALIREALASGRPVKISDLVLVERWAAERQKPPGLDLSSASAEDLAALDSILTRIETGADPVHERYPYDPQSVREQRDAFAAQLAALGPEPAQLAAELAAVELELEQARAALASITIERDDARSALARIDVTRLWALDPKGVLTPS